MIPFLFLPLLSFSFWVATGPFIFIHSIASRDLMRNVAVYYGAPFYPFLIFYFLKIAKEKSWGIKTLVPFFLIATLVGSGTLVYRPYSSGYFAFRSFWKSLPLEKGDKVCAQASILPHLGYEQKLMPLKWCSPEEDFKYIVVASHLKDYGISGKDKAILLERFRARGYKNIAAAKKLEKFKIYQR